MAVKAASPPREIETHLCALTSFNVLLPESFGRWKLLKNKNGVQCANVFSIIIAKLFITTKYYMKNNPIPVLTLLHIISLYYQSSF